MPISCLNVRWDVIQSLHSITRSTDLGTDRHDEADLAIVLALSPNRAVDSALFLRRNVLRDARRIRRRQIAKMIVVSALVDEVEGAEAFFERSQPPVPSAEATISAAELESQIRRESARMPHGEVCFDAMLAGESPGETAARLGIPRHRVEYVRTKIRRIATDTLRSLD